MQAHRVRISAAEPILAPPGLRETVFPPCRGNEGGAWVRRPPPPLYTGVDRGWQYDLAETTGGGASRLCEHRHWTIDEARELVRSSLVWCGGLVCE